MVDGRAHQCLAVAFHPLGRPELGPAPTACVSDPDRRRRPMRFSAKVLEGKPSNNVAPPRPDGQYAD
jgi:hypothetical protein